MMAHNLDTRDRFAALKAQSDQLLDAACGAAWVQGLCVGAIVGFAAAALCWMLMLWIVGRL